MTCSASSAETGWDDDERSVSKPPIDDHQRTRESSPDPSERSVDDPDHPFWDVRLRIYESEDSWEYDSGLSDIPDPNSDSDDYSDDEYLAI